ncbi:hypothetical protein PGQ11_002583 [Apiospora arundinis]|uniref:Uncharacterized protein n=1 Tax=Apiospora arundinis TaxID=335852 RepID=A0ABR2JJ10_9PEZI
MSRSKPDTREAHLFNLEERNDEENAVCGSKSSTADSPFYDYTETSFNVAPMNATSTEAQASSRSGPGPTMTTPSPETSETQKASMSTQVLASDGYATSNDRYYHMDEAIKAMNAARKIAPSMLRSLLDQTGQALLLTAADYLQPMNDKSFKKSQVFSPMALSCARTAETTSQRKFVREDLLRRLRTLEYYDTGPSETMLQRMLLAQVGSLNEQSALADHPFDSTLKPAVDSHGFSDASFDVLAYLSHKHSRRETDPRFWNQDGTSDFSDDRMASICHHEFIQFIVDLRCSSGVRSIPSDQNDPSTMVSDYVKSCIEWCAIVISVDCELFDTSRSAEDPRPLRQAWRGKLLLYTTTSIEDGVMSLSIGSG